MENSRFSSMGLLGVFTMLAYTVNLQKVEVNTDGSQTDQATVFRIP